MEKIIATNDTLRQIIIEEIDRLGVDANLNHIDTSQVTDMSAVFANLHFYGDISNWNTNERNVHRLIV